MNKNDNQNNEEYEKELRRRLKVLLKQFEAGNIKINKDLNVIPSLKAVRTGPDGEIDLNTVDGLVRSLALAVTHMHDREELKKEASLNEIQNMYFKFIEDNFAELFKIMVTKKMTPGEIGEVFRNNEQFRKEVLGNSEDFLNVIDQFWDNLGEIGHIHVEDMHSNIKGIYGGDLFPSHGENIASKCAIYTDTIVLPDPFLRSKFIFTQFNSADKAYYIVKHAMNILQYKELACADTKVPIVVILPDLAALQKDEVDLIKKLGEQDTLAHSAKLFGRNFESIKELMDFCGSLDTIEKTIKNISDEDRVLFDTEWDEDLETQIQKHITTPHMRPFGDISPAHALTVNSLGRMGTSNELLIKSRRLRGTPILDAPTSWQYLVWKMEYDANSAESELESQNLHVLKALSTSTHPDMKWLGNIPPEALLEVRKMDAMDEIRSILGKGVKQLVESNPANFHKSREQILKNIQNAFEQHQKNLNDLTKKKWKFAGKDIGTWLVVGSIEVAAAITGTPFLGVSALLANQFVEPTKLKDIPGSIRDLINEDKDIKHSPVGMLFDVHTKFR
ncbi:MAG: hypothetical protein ACNI27_08525 [Desulfovibrio sp.]